jgi:lauroyl/myristoyl acyltransferase
MLSAARNLPQLRRAVPVRAVPALVRRRLDRIWSDPEFRRIQEGQMQLLLGHTERAPEVPELAYRYAEQMMLRAYLRWHPKAISRQRVRGIEWLTTRRDQSRGVVLSFMHHAHYEGMFPSLARVGAQLHALAHPLIAGGDAGVELDQHLHVVSRGARVVPASGGTEAIASVLGPGVTLAIASDLPGHTPVTFLGRRVLGSFGAARIAAMTNSPVVLVTVRRDEAGSYLQLEQPLEPKDYGDAGELLDDILRRHEGPVLAWPEALDAIGARFGELDE